ncbi:MAG: FAD-dependent oxidoreductase [Clostridia bacterium]|nr:FAD-dependent oxidoreductase [Clostridia bacterium]
MKQNGLTEKRLECDLCIVGGGMAGLCAAVTAAREGLDVVLIHERPVPGGNASGEVRMWICGVQEAPVREAGLVEELALENLRYNPTKNYAIWDTLLYAKATRTERLTSLLNCTCFAAETDGETIRSVTAYQMTTQTLYTVTAKLFADCSGDSVLAPLTGADFMYGRESLDEYGESMMRTHRDADLRTMGNSCLLQAREVGHPVPFHAPEWAERVPVEKLRERGVDLRNPGENFWYIEIGGMDDVIGKAEDYNKRLIAVCLGIWDTIKNSGRYPADNLELDFIGMLAAKRESRRMTGDYVMTANDVAEGRAFPDEVAYGGWPLDDHMPEGWDGSRGNYSIPVKPYGIPYRCLYSVNISNLFFAGRNVSMTHMAMSSARVMGTCSTLGHAVGAAASVCVRHGVTPRGASAYIDEIQQTLLRHDCFLPHVERRIIPGNLSAAASHPVLMNGRDRDLPGEENGAYVPNGQTVTMTFAEPVRASGIKLVFDSDLARSTYDVHSVEKTHIMRANQLESSPLMGLPPTLASDFTVTVVSGAESRSFDFRDNIRRNVLIPLGCEVSSVSLTVKANHGKTAYTKVFTFEIF